MGDSCTGHGCWPPRASVSGSPNVYVNSIPVHREGDGWGAHTCPAIPETHAGVLGAGSGTVYVNGKQIGRIGDPVSCGSSVASASSDVFAGG
ncbi:MAG: PAAR domain-containing protein [Pikeienuella sp.]